MHEHRMRYFSKSKKINTTHILYASSLILLVGLARLEEDRFTESTQPIIVLHLEFDAKIYI